MYQPIRISHWNINGWTATNSILRKFAIESLNSDIISLNETHLCGNDMIYFDGYAWIGNNRQNLHINAPKGSGGVGLLIKADISKSFNVSILDKSFDGNILGVKFSDKVSDFTFIIYSCYFPPEGANRGRDVDDMFAHLVNQLYIYSDIEHIYLCGDFNARVGNKVDFIPDIDNLPPRRNIDTQSNTFGDALIDFLKDTKFAILNGRISPGLDNYTSISNRGNAVVDYILSNHSNISNCSNFIVEKSSDIIDNIGLLELIGPGCKIPDHSILSFDFEIPHIINFSEPYSVNHEENYEQKERKYDVSNIPHEFCNNHEFIQKITDLTESLTLLNHQQNAVDVLYNSFVKLLTNEMDSYLNYKDYYPSRKTRKRLKNNKPYWNEELNHLWKNMKCFEKRFLKCRRSNSQWHNLKRSFLEAQKLFDKTLKKCRRAYQMQLQDKVETLNTSNPTEFWKYINELGPKKKVNVPLEVLNSENKICSDTKTVLQIWKNDFESLFQNKMAEHVFDDNFYIHLINERNIQENAASTMIDNDSLLNKQIDFIEVKNVVMNAKNKKAVGIDKIPYEILKFDNVINFLTDLFKKIFQFGIMPSDWYKAIIVPIPKNSSDDPRVPLNYRGISLLSNVYKMYSSVLNNRLMKFCCLNDTLVDEQNGFRPRRSCLDHLYVLTTIIRTRKSTSQSTFTAFVDMKKAFDWTNHELLFYKLLNNGITGRLYNAIKLIYKNPLSCLRLNSFYTDWFSPENGVRQGDTMSPTLFALYINDLVENLNEIGKGVKIGNNSVSALLYADDIVLLAEKETDLQDMLNVLDKWCTNWRMVVNISKTKILHFRPKSTISSTFEFKLGRTVLNYSSSYKYLGLILDDHLDFNKSAELLSDAAGRALGSVINMFKNNGNLGFKTFTKLFESCITPILDYCSGVWGFRNFQCCETIQNRAMRFYLGVNRFCPNQAVSGDMGWEPTINKRKLNMLRLWNRLVDLPNDRITKKIFLWDHSVNRNNWCSDVKKLFGEIQQIDCFNNITSCNLNSAKHIIFENTKITWSQTIIDKPKLRTYVLFKENFHVEKYVLFNLTRTERSLMAQFRSGTLPLHIELGRYINLPVNERICICCNQNLVEDESHFMFVCQMYNDLRDDLFSNISETSFINLSNNDKFKTLFNAFPRQTAKFILKAFMRRKQFIYPTV